MARALAEERGDADVFKLKAFMNKSAGTSSSNTDSTTAPKKTAAVLSKSASSSLGTGDEKRVALVEPDEEMDLL